jgi:predicted dehydrogenase
MSTIRAGVIGAGYLGRFHAQKYASLSQCQLVGVADPREAARAAVSTEVGTQGYESFADLIGRVDAVSIVTPTPSHFEIARDCLRAGVHVLVEKPITETVEQARELVRLANAAGLVLQVGHLERFNPAIVAAEPWLAGARFIECQRLAPFKERGTDVSVVLDLMIHDIDIVQTIVGADLESVDAIGTRVFSSDADIANARLKFVNGCVANVTASRVSLKTERKLRVFRDDAYLSIDLQQKILTVIRKRDPDSVGAGLAGLPVELQEQNFDAGDALKAEIEAFVRSVRDRSRAVVSGEDGLRALETAVRISEALRA